MCFRLLMWALLITLLLTVNIGGQVSGQQVVVDPAPPKPVAIDITQLQKQAISGDAAAQFTLAKAYETGNGVKQSAEQAATWYRKSAEQGNAQAENSLGVMYWIGNGVDQDKKQAVQWYRKAARQGDATAMFNLGAAYYNGEGVDTVNDTLAYAWFILSSDAGSETGRDAARRSKSDRGPGAFKDACFVIGELYEKGEDLPKNIALASSWYRKAAEQGHAQAQLGLAHLYLNAKDYREAFRWCESAAKGREPEGHFCLGYLHQRGLGAKADGKTALKEYEEAARWGNASAMLAMGRMLANGDGTKQDRPRGFIWYFLAARRGNQEALSAATALRASMGEKEWKDTQKKLKGQGFDTKSVDEVFAGKGPQPQ